MVVGVAVGAVGVAAVEDDVGSAGEVEGEVVLVVLLASGAGLGLGGLVPAQMTDGQIVNDGA